MKKQIKTLLLVGALIAGIGFTSVSKAEVGFANSTTGDFKVAVVDVTAVVAKSSEVQSLKQEQEAKLAELKTWLENVRADVAKQQTKEGKEKLIKKYDAEFAKKQETIKAAYAKKLQKIDKDISTVIAQEAKNQGYAMVFAKGTVLYGGNDITKNIINLVK